MNGMNVMAKPKNKNEKCPKIKFFSDLVLSLLSHSSVAKFDLGLVP